MLTEDVRGRAEAVAGGWCRSRRLRRPHWPPSHKWGPRCGAGGRVCEGLLGTVDRNQCPAGATSVVQPWDGYSVPPPPPTPPPMTNCFRHEGKCLGHTVNCSGLLWFSFVQFLMAVALTEKGECEQRPRLAAPAPGHTNQPTLR